MPSSRKPVPYKMFAVIFLALISLAVTPTAFAQTETILYNFCSQSTCTDGSVPYAGVVMDRNGNLYGTTRYGGSNNNGGTAFRLKPSGALQVLHRFANDGKDGFAPYGGVVLDQKGNLYGATYEGGSHSDGAVFKVTSAGTETILYNFGSQPEDGLSPPSSLLLDARGNLYGANFFGGASGSSGAVFKLSADGTEKVLHSFAGYPSDGANPSGALIMDRHGNLYGTTRQGGANGYGTVYKLHPDGTEIILHSFNFDGTDGYYPYAGLVLDSAGNLYGTTYQGGANNAGIVFEIDAAGAESVLYSFGASSTDGFGPRAGLVRDAQGNLYGTTLYGGLNGSNFGTVFKLSPSGTETILHSFAEDGTDGYQSYGTLMMDAAGNLYGTTSAGGTGAANTGGAGTIFRITP